MKLEPCIALFKLFAGSKWIEKYALRVEWLTNTTTGIKQVNDEIILHT